MLFCYNTPVNLNNQIDWHDLHRIVSSDTRYVSSNGNWWRESSTWQTRQDGSSAITPESCSYSSLWCAFGETRPRMESECRQRSTDIFPDEDIGFDVTGKPTKVLGADLF